MTSSPGANVSQSSHSEIPTMDGLIAQYERVLSELDELMSALIVGTVSAQKDLVPGDEGTTP
jgi:hypothetical protein